MSTVGVMLAAYVTASTANAEIPKLSQEELQSAASHAFAGVVQQTYDRTETKGDFEYTFGVAEVSVERVDKGTDIVANDRIFVRYWRKKWVGHGNPAPDHYGHWNIPEKADAAIVYVKGDRKTGFDVLSPNGFFKAAKAEASVSESNP